MSGLLITINITMKYEAYNLLFERIKQIDETKPLASSGAIKDKNGNLLRENDITILMIHGQNEYGRMIRQ